MLENRFLSEDPRGDSSSSPASMPYLNSRGYSYTPLYSSSLDRVLVTGTNAGSHSIVCYIYNFVFAIFRFVGVDACRGCDSHGAAGPTLTLTLTLTL